MNPDRRKMLVGASAIAGATLLTVSPPSNSQATTSSGEGPVSITDFGASPESTPTANKVAIQAAIGASRRVVVPRGLIFVTDGDLVVDGGLHISGGGELKLDPLSSDSLFVLADGASDVVFDDLILTGNFDSSVVLTEDDNTGSCAIRCPTGNSMSLNIAVSNCRISKFLAHGVLLDNAHGINIRNNIIEDMRFGAGVLLSYTNMSSGITVDGNRIERTQKASVQGFVTVSNVVVSNNVLMDSGNWPEQYPYEQSDNITLYAHSGSEQLIIADNVCVNGGMNNIHAGGNNVSITGNICRNPAVHSNIYFGKKENEAPADAVNVTISNNICYGAGRADEDFWNIGVTNCRGFTVTGNVCCNANYGIVVRGLGVGRAGCQSGTVANNVIYDIGDESQATLPNVGLRVRGLVVDCLFSGNFVREAVNAVSFEDGATVGDNVVSFNHARSISNPVPAWFSGLSNLYVGRGLSGAVVVEGGNDAIIEGDGNTGLSVLTPGNAMGFVMFGSPTGGNDGQISYSHSARELGLRAGGLTNVRIQGTKLGFFGAQASAKPVITGSRGGNAALTSLLSQLASLGLITDSSTG